jgi:hypothetical protein
VLWGKSPEDIIEALEKAGYGAKLKSPKKGTSGLAQLIEVTGYKGVDH